MEINIATAKHCRLNHGLCSLLLQLLVQQPNSLQEVWLAPTSGDTICRIGVGIDRLHRPPFGVQLPNPNLHFSG